MEIPLSFPSIVTTRRVVPNSFPVVDSTYRMAIVGEAPGEHEEDHLQPFIGPSGNLLNSMLQDEGINRLACFVGNICQVRPPANRLEAFPWDSGYIADGIAQLKADLQQFKPNIVVCLGNAPLHVSKTSDAPRIKSGKFDWPYSISQWCSSLFISSTLGYKTIGAFHPAYILRQWNHNFPRTRWSLNRALQEAASPTLVLPQRELIINESAGSLCYIMDTWPAGQKCSLDIEGGLPAYMVNEGVKLDAKERRHLNWKCVAISARPTKAYAIRWSAFSESEHVNLIRSFARLMYRNDVPKTLQNSLYEQFVLPYGYQVVVRNVTDDVMLKGWESYCELPKSLSVQASIYTREPHWKDDEMYGGTGDSLATGCCKDVCVTGEIANAHDNILDVKGQAHYRFNLSMLDPLKFMELKGIKYDKESAERLAKPRRKAHRKIGDWLDRAAGEPLRGPKGSLVPQRLCRVLYEKKGYPAQFKKEAGRRTEKLTSDVEAILTLAKRSPSDTFLRGILRHRHLEGLLETLAIKSDDDGRVRCGYNVVGTETGRLTCYTSPTGAGANLTTITKSLRKNYIADSDYDFFQCDLSGADGWTVAAHCARLGDSKMLDDFNAGLKPAKILCLLYLFGDAANQLSLDDLKFWHNGKGWKAVEAVLGAGFYDCTKATVHGSNYLMKIPTLVKNILIKSYKYLGAPIYLEQSVARTLQDLYFSRYPGVRTWHQWAESKLVADGALTSASGHTRIFFGRRYGKDIHETVKEFLADEPQQTTTYVTNLAMLNLWNDIENRRINGSLVIEPLHQVHDALCGQWPQVVREWARAKVKSYFDNEIEVAGIKLKIPFEGAYGPSWGQLPNKL